MTHHQNVTFKPACPNTNTTESTSQELAPLWEHQTIQSRDKWSDELRYAVAQG